MPQQSNRSVLHVGPPMPSAVKQISGLQILRAVAVTVVAWGHAGLFYMSPDGTHLPDMGVFGIDIFFVLSGFILSAVVLRSDSRSGPNAAWQFFKRRLIRIFPIYWLFAAVSIALLIHRHNFRTGSLYSLLLLPFPQYPPMPMLVEFSWTLIFEMFFYSMLAAIQIFTVKWAIPILIGVLLAFTALRLMISIQKPVLIVAANPMLLEFAYGSAIALAHRTWGRHRRVGVFLIAIGSSAAFAFVGGKISSPTQQLILLDEHVLFRVCTWGVAAAAIVAGTVFLEGEPRGRPGNFLVRLGDASYSAYLGSALTIYVCSRLLQRVFSQGHGPQLAIRGLCQLLSVLAVLAVGLASYDYVEQPMLRFLQKRFL